MNSEHLSRRDFLKLLFNIGGPLLAPPAFLWWLAANTRSSSAAEPAALAHEHLQAANKEIIAPVVADQASAETAGPSCFAPPEKVPFTQISWTGAPYPAGQVHAFDSVDWPQVKQWNCLVDKYANADLGQGQSLAETLAGAALDLNLPLALIWVESRGDPNANSHSNAVGIMQVMASNSGAYYNSKGEPLFANRPTMAELFDPETNIYWGCRILAADVALTQSLAGGLDRYYGRPGCQYSNLVFWLHQNIIAS